MKKVSVLICFLCLFAFVRAELATEELSSVTSEGPMPQSLVQLLQSKPKNDSYNGYLKVSLQRGDLIFGSSLNRYLDQIVDRLLAKEPELRPLITVCVLKSTTVNAFITNQGILVVNMGLIAQSMNESELAFVLAHEITHYAAHHVMSEDQKTKKEADNFDNYINYHNRSREQELEADEMGVNRFYLPSGYDAASVDGIFDLLLYGDLPFDEVPFTRAVVETAFYKFDDKLFLPSVSPIQLYENWVDSLSTHPNIKRRREIMSSILKKQSNPFTPDTVPSASFIAQRRVARHACLSIYLTQHQYDKAYYNAYVMLAKDSDDYMAQLVKVFALYGLSKHKAVQGLNDVVTSYRKVMGEQQQFNYFISKINSRELSVLALRECYLFEQKYPNQPLLTQMTRGLMVDVAQKHKLTTYNFASYPMGQQPLIEPTVVAGDSVVGRRSKSSSSKSVSDFKGVLPFMLVDLITNPEFKDRFEAIPRAEDKEVLEILSEHKKLPAIDQLVLFPPMLELRYIKRDDKRATVAREYADNITKQVFKAAPLLPINIREFSSEGQLLDVASYNYNAAIWDWVRDYIKGQDCNMIPFQRFLIEPYLSIYHDRHILLLSGAVDRKKSPLWSALSSTIPFVYVWPFALPFRITHMALPSVSTSFNVAIVDIQTSEIAMQDHCSYDTKKQAFPYINAFVYDCLYNIKKGGRR